MKTDTDKTHINEIQEKMKHAYTMMSEYEELAEKVRVGNIGTSLLLRVEISKHLYWPEKNQLDSPLKLASDLIVQKANERYYYWSTEFDRYSKQLAEELCMKGE